MTAVLIVPGLRGHVEDHWQTLLAAELAAESCVVHSVAPLEVDGLSCAARVAAIEAALAGIDGLVVLVAHSAGVLMVAHWAARHAASAHRIAGALLVTPPDLDAPWPSNYPSPEVLREQGWAPLPRTALPFPSLVCASDNDHLASPQAVRALAADWGSEMLELGSVGHMNPAAGYGHWPLALPLVQGLRTGCADELS